MLSCRKLRENERARAFGNSRTMVRANPVIIHNRGAWRGLEAVEYAALEWVDLFNDGHLHEPIRTFPPAEAEASFSATLETEAMVPNQRKSASGKPGMVHQGHRCIV